MMAVSAGFLRVLGTLQPTALLWIGRVGLSRILIVSFFNYIQVISHGKVGGKGFHLSVIVLVIKSLSPNVHDNFKQQYR